MPDFIALWEIDGRPRFHTNPIQVDSLQIILDDAKKNKIDLIAVFDITGKEDQPIKVYEKDKKNV
jgi:hypothetical protein